MDATEDSIEEVLSGLSQSKICKHKYSVSLSLASLGAQHAKMLAMLYAIDVEGLFGLEAWSSLLQSKTNFLLTNLEQGSSSICRCRSLQCYQLSTKHFFDGVTKHLSFDDSDKQLPTVATLTEKGRKWEMKGILVNKKE
ncbi:unnamed protein product [Citrullus colocynthis]|uniref:Uncharacterized protein n=1 Tax=Citrullus colocynthis TaxID=252529 RepID=A0ABP0XKD7_9ROSI